MTRVADRRGVRRAGLRLRAPWATSSPRSPPPSVTRSGAADQPGAARRAVVRRVPGRRTRRPAADALRPRRAVPGLAVRRRRQPATAGVPSTTATSLTSLGTGAAAGRPRPGRLHLADPRHRPAAQRAASGTSPSTRVEWQPHPTAFARLAAAGVTVTVVNKREFSGSGLTVAAQRGRRLRRRRPGRRADRCRGRALGGSGPSLTYVYDGDLDWTGHRFGVASSQWLQQLAMVDAEAEQLRETLPADVRLLVVADHGMVDSPPREPDRRRRPPRAARRAGARRRRGPVPPPLHAARCASTTSSPPGASHLGDARRGAHP